MRRFAARPRPALPGSRGCRGPTARPLTPLRGARDPCYVVAMSDDCTKTYNNVDPAHRDMLLANLRAMGADVTGSNPYDVDTHQSSVKLHAVYDASAQTLTVTITDKPGWPVSCGMVWDKIDPNVQKVLATPAPTDANAVAMGQVLAGAGTTSDADVAALKADIASIGQAPAPAPSSPATTPAASKPTASAAGATGGVLNWVVAHPVPSIGIAGALGYLAYRWLKK